MNTSPGHEVNKPAKNNIKLYVDIVLVLILVSAAACFIIWYGETLVGFCTKKIDPYQQAIIKTRFPTPAMIDTVLYAISDTIDSVTVVTFKTTADAGNYYRNDSTGKCDLKSYENWVTVQAELNSRLKTVFADEVADTVLRIEQLLGLPAAPGNYSFVVMRVACNDVFRPCPDSSIHDCKCDLSFNEKTDPEYVKWFNAQRTSRFFNPDPSKDYPFTQLGYTYDWSPYSEKHFGLSEFVIKKKTKVVIADTPSLSTYFAGLAKSK